MGLFGRSSGSGGDGSGSHPNADAMSDDEFFENLGNLTDAVRNGPVGETTDAADAAAAKFGNDGRA
ncbi:hypothetical protein [Kitasatospora phosalacinea]|uniref:Uncharacterized protein n=1 Tax=Kitasatospora phosalacinea TaxID=2065 RepID=A0A9W6UPD6_9ACTN|nr:hypothetical protein [Kitasatospora phosalacinea]GLW55228.1 hypothetical protein Kpho01_32390 [Kitasatospora phosalacinea]